MGKRENKYQSELIKRIKDRFPGCIVLKNDPTYIQGIPDLLILYEDRWAALEVKRNYKESLDPQPNQLWYVHRMDAMSFASIIYPENEEEVLNDLEQSFEGRQRRRSRYTRRKSTRLA